MKKARPSQSDPHDAVRQRGSHLWRCDRVRLIYVELGVEEPAVEAGDWSGGSLGWRVAGVQEAWV